MQPGLSMSTLGRMKRSCASLSCTWSSKLAKGKGDEIVGHSAQATAHEVTQGFAAGAHVQSQRVPGRLHLVHW